MIKLPIWKTSLRVNNGRSVQLPSKTAEDYYRTGHHAAWSRAVRQRAAGRCEACGRHGTRLFADHIKELRDGGTWDLANGQALCGRCHTNKTNEERMKRATMWMTHLDAFKGG